MPIAHLTGRGPCHSRRPPGNRNKLRPHPSGPQRKAGRSVEDELVARMDWSAFRTPADNAILQGTHLPKAVMHPEQEGDSGAFKLPFNPNIIKTVA